MSEDENQESGVGFLSEAYLLLYVGGLSVILSWMIRFKEIFNICFMDFFVYRNGADGNHVLLVGSETGKSVFD